jgi:membrane complex biogenesis BtpA family protein
VRELFDEKPILGMVHMPALPGAPRSELGVEALVEWAVAEAAKLERAGLDACIVENVGDVPLFRDRVPPVTTAAMAVLVTEVKRSTRLKVGVNILRNACEEALSVAHVCGADFIRCNVVIGAYVTDQGIVQGCAAELARLRRALDSHVLVFGDVHVKHAHPLFDVPIEYAAQDLAERGGVDAVIVSGPRSPIPPTWERLEAVKGAVELPVLIGSGVGLENVREFYERSDGVLLGEPDFKVGRVWGGDSDEAAYADAVRRCRS